MTSWLRHFGHPNMLSPLLLPEKTAYMKNILLLTPYFFISRPPVDEPILRFIPCEFFQREKGLPPLKIVHRFLMPPEMSAWSFHCSVFILDRTLDRRSRL
jgi:hypothetical protein